MDHWQRVMHSELQARLHPRHHHVLASCIEDGDDWQQCLTEAGFDPSNPTFWMLQGTLPLIEPNTIKHVVSGIDALSAPHSKLVTEMLTGGDITMETVEDDIIDYTVHGEVHYGEDGGVFLDFPWDATMLGRRTQGGE